MADLFREILMRFQTRYVNGIIAVTGVAAAGATITFADGKGNSLGTTLADPTTGTYTFNPAAQGNTNIGQGKQTIIATEVGNPVTASIDLTYDTTPPTITSDVATPTMGDLEAGKVVTFTLVTSEAVTVTGTPTLTLNDGGTATYTGLTSISGGSALKFSYTVAAGQNTTALAVTGVNLPNGATIMDVAGNSANLAGADATFNGLKVDTTSPTITAEAASPTGADLDAAKVVTFTVQTSEAVTATGSSLSLSNGANANYTSGGTAQANGSVSPLTFTYTVASTDANTADLRATALNGTITDGAGNMLNDAGFQAIDTTDQIDTVAPTITAIAESGPGVSAGGGGDLGAGKTVTLTVTTSEAVTVTPGAGGATPTLSLNDGGTATYTGGSRCAIRG